MRNFLVGSATLACALALAACGGSSSSSPCSGVTGTCVAFSSGAAESDIRNAFVTAAANSTIAFGAGTFTFTNTLNIAVAGLTVKGAGIDKTTFDFSTQTAGSEGIYAADHSDSLKLTGFTVSNSKGNAIKVINSNGVTFDTVKTIWTSATLSTHGAYGLYPVSCQNVKITNSDVEGASDSGIYVGQSDKIIVSNNTVSKNVAGIEIENSFNADVSGNTATGNTGGILVFDLPNLPQLGGHNVRVFNNMITNNNTANFAAQGDIVGLVPAGTGSFVMANHDVEFFGNTFSGNNTAAFSVVSYYLAQKPITDPNYYPLPQRVYEHDNTFTNNGTSADTTNQLGLLLLSGFSPSPIPNTLYDGIVDAHVTGGVSANNEMSICLGTAAASTSFANLHFDQLNPQAPNLKAVLTTDVTAYACALTPLPAVTVTAP